MINTEKVLLEDVVLVVYEESAKLLDLCLFSLVLCRKFINFIFEFFEENYVFTALEAKSIDLQIDLL